MKKKKGIWAILLFTFLLSWFSGSMISSYMQVTEVRKDMTGPLSKLLVFLWSHCHFRSKFWFEREGWSSSCQHRITSATHVTHSLGVFILTFSDRSISTWIPSHALSLNSKILKPLLNSVGRYLKFRTQQEQTSSTSLSSNQVSAHLVNTTYLCNQFLSLVGEAMY